MSPGVKRFTRCSRGWKRIKASVTPATLKMMCAQAARLASVLVPMEARKAVMVVPIFEPRIKAVAV